MIKALITLLFCVTTVVAAQESHASLTLKTAIDAALLADPWLRGSEHRQDALMAEAVAASTLPDPRISLMAGNFPLDSFDINQEAMTQLSVGVTQMFPRGSSLSLASRQKQELAAQEPMLRWDRQAKVTATVAQIWLEAFKAQESIRLIERDRSLFEQLVDAAEAGYSSALGRARQQDVVRAQLELTQLENRLTLLLQQQQVAQQRLAEWIGSQAMVELPATLPNQTVTAALEDMSSNVPQTRYDYIRRHPAIQAIEKRIDAMQTGVELSRQKYKPEWGLSTQYGYRADDPMGRSRSDLFSVGVTFDVPLFTGKRQDKEVSASVSRLEALKTDKQLLIRQFMAEIDTSNVQLQRLDERHTLYRTRLIPQMSTQAGAALNAYNNDDGDFAEAVRARIAELNARIDLLLITVERQQVIVRLNYLLTGINGAESDMTE